jgi:hypothetical protein
MQKTKNYFLTDNVTGKQQNFDEMETPAGAPQCRSCIRLLHPLTFLTTFLSSAATSSR